MPSFLERNILNLSHNNGVKFRATYYRVIQLFIMVNIAICGFSYLFYLLSRFHGEKHPWLNILYRLVAVDVESNLPTWYSANLWFLMAIIGAILAYIGRKHLIYRRGACLLALVAVLASLDEIAQFHENLGTIGHLLFGGSQDDMPVTANYLWILPGLAIILVISFALWKFINALPSLLARGVFMGGAMFIIGAIGIEFLSGVWWLKFGSDAYYNIIITLEELFEMTGVSIALVSLVFAINVRKNALGLYLVKDE